MTDSSKRYHRRGEPGGPGCQVGELEVELTDRHGKPAAGHLLCADDQASEIELLRTVASRLAVKWGKDELGWWAVVPRETAGSWAVWREDDNGARFLVEQELSENEAVALVARLESTGHKQLYWMERVASADD